MSYVVATAGHVDHGKSSMVLALTGTDPDRWPEEKARGLTIDLGFAQCSIGDVHVAWVDVPGHVRFIRNMLAGVGSLDAAVLVVAATEGWKPQTEEHLRILDLLGVEDAVVAISKADLVDEALLDQRRVEVGQRIAGTGLAGAAIIEIDSVSGRGLDDLRTALVSVLSARPGAADWGRPRLWVDRVFSARGAGTIATGTLSGGSLNLGDSLCVVGPSAAGVESREVRVRGIQVHATDRECVGPGNRVALNLTGASRADFGRGDALLTPEHWAPTDRADATLRVLPGLGHSISRRGAYALYSGTVEQAVKVRILGADSLDPGTNGLVRLHLAAPVPWLPGDRYILRDQGRGQTLGGGEILDVDPLLPSRRARPDRRVERVVAERGWVEADRLRRLTGFDVAPTLGSWVVDPAALRDAEAQLRARVEAAGDFGLDVAVLDERMRSVAEDRPGFEVRDGWVRLVPAADDSARAAAAVQASKAGRSARAGMAAAAKHRNEHPWLVALDRSPWSPPHPSEFDVPPPLLRQAVQSGRVIERDGVWFAASGVDRAARVVAKLLASSPEGVTVSTVRDALGSSRKHVLPLLNHLDATGVTRRRGDLRIGGPRLPELDSAAGLEPNAPASDGI